MYEIALRPGMRAFVVRHGQSEWNGAHRVTGQRDPDLSAKGVAQSRALARVLRDIPLDGIYTSTLRRAVNTAQPVAILKGFDINRHDALKEIHLGVLQGRYRDARDPEAEQLWQVREQDKLHFRPPGGESYAELESRVTGRLHEILSDDKQQSILIVGHRNTNRVILGILMGWPRERWTAFNIRANYLYEIEQQGSPSLYTIPLSGSAAGTRYVECS